MSETRSHSSFLSDDASPSAFVSHAAGRKSTYIDALEVCAEVFKGHPEDSVGRVALGVVAQRAHLLRPLVAAVTPVALPLTLAPAHERK